MLRSVFAIVLFLVASNVPALAQTNKPATTSATALDNRAKALMNAGKYSEALALFVRAAKLGDLNGEIAAGQMYMSGQGTPKNNTQALVWLQAAANQGDGYEAKIVAYIYINGGFGVTQNSQTGLFWLHKAIDLGRSDAASDMGDIYRDGKPGIPPDPTQARIWYQKAISMGSTRAQSELAQLNAGTQPAPATTQQGTCSAVYITGEDEPPYGQHFFYGAGWGAATYDDALATANAELVKFAAGIDPRMLPGGQYGPTPEQGSGCTYAHGAVAGKLKISPPGSSMFNPSGAAGTAPMGPGIYDIIAAGFADSTDDAVAAAMAKCKSKNGPGDWEHEVCAVLTQW